MSARGKQDEFAKRRRQLMRIMGKDAIAILPAAPVRLRNGDVEYNYRPDSDFYYLSGFAEPEAVAVLLPGRPQGEYVLFVRDRDPAREAWDGARAGPEGAVGEFGADDAFPIQDIDEILPGLLERCARVYYTMGAHPEFDKRVIGWVNRLRSQAKQGAHTPHEFVALDHPLHEMRLFKSRAELASMRRSAQIACAAHRRALAVAAPGRMEYEVMAELLHEFHRRRADISYHPIVGSGPNSCVLHYRANARQMKDGELLLIDAGCEFQYYASDVTRTLPVNGRYTPRQRAVYEVVLAAQRAAIAKVRAGAVWNDPHEAAVRAITQGLVRIGLLKGRVARLIRDGSYRQFFMHRTGHWLGMDVHDVGEYKVGDQWRLLEPGMVMTIEPGIYIAPGTKGVRREWWGIGVRIEDDVVVTAGDPEVLTAAMPTDPDEIEALMAAA
ncbi:MAG TPA: aminopeptidase P N-terminal domain-containing protein [Steroidobacteraceae bacterium]|nr:aminopeptidase P N-terminal domain-containing protein [Steroidobacteraceae bacterium]